MDQLGRPLLGLLEAALSIDHSEVHVAILVALASTASDMPSTPALALGLLRAAHANPNETTGPALAPLCERWCRQIEALLAQAPRHENDWSFVLSLHCRCKFCGEFGGFLREATRMRFEWPLAQAHRKHPHRKHPHRKHLQRVIGTHALPLTHMTRRSGRPYVLVLEKTPALFAREAAQRRAWQQDLEWLLVSSSRVQRNHGCRGSRRSQAASCGQLRPPQPMAGDVALIQMMQLGRDRGDELLSVTAFDLTFDEAGNRGQVIWADTFRGDSANHIDKPRGSAGRASLAHAMGRESPCTRLSRHAKSLPARRIAAQ